MIQLRIINRYFFNDVSILLRDTEVGSRAVEVDGIGSRMLLLTLYMVH